MHLLEALFQQVEKESYMENIEKLPRSNLLFHHPWGFTNADLVFSIVECFKRTTNPNTADEARRGM